MLVCLRSRVNQKVKWLIVVFCIAFILLLLFIESITPVFADSGVYVPNEQFVFVKGVHNELQVVEVVQFQNRTSAYQTVKLPLPTNYKSLSVKTNRAYQPAFHDATKFNQFLRPHSSEQVILTYVIPQSSKTGFTLMIHNSYFVDAAILYIPIGNMEVSSPNLLAATQTETIGGTHFRVFTRLGIRVGEPFMMNLSLYPKQNLSVSESEMPVIGQTRTGSSGSVQAIANLLIAFFILVIGFLSIRTTH